jgi:hypothetical protein
MVTIVGFAIATIGILVGAGFRVMGYSRPDFRIARWCFILSALVAVATDVKWMTTAEYPLNMRLIVGVAVCGLAGIGLFAALRWTKNRECQSASPASSVHQRSEGPNSPNIVGDKNQVT